MEVIGGRGSVKFHFSCQKRHEVVTKGIEGGIEQVKLQGNEKLVERVVRGPSDDV